MESRIESGIYVRPCDGETLSGDVVFVQPQGDGVFAVVIDALGHGPDAHRLGVQLIAALSGWLPRGSASRPERMLLRSCMKAPEAREGPQQRWRGSIPGRSRDG